jgi:hypothetical protein
MDYLTDADLVRLTTGLATVLRALTGWHEPPRLYGLLPAGAVPRAAGVVHAGGRRWLRLAEGDPYTFLDTVRVTDRDVSAVALATCGWALPERVRIRALAVVTPDRRQCSAVERRDTGEVVVDGDGEGPMMRALLSVWDDHETAWPPPAA